MLSHEGFVQVLLVARWVALTNNTSSFSGPDVAPSGNAGRVQNPVLMSVPFVPRF